MVSNQLELEAQYVMGTYARRPIEFVRGEGMRLWDSDGREYLDFLSGVGAVSMGHCHPRVTEAVCEQASGVVHVSNYFHVPHRGELAGAIDSLLGGGWRTFFANSGGEAAEAAIKIARKWGGTHKGGAYAVVSAEGSFHGRSLATLAATGQPAKQAGFLPMPDGFGHVPLNDIEALESAVDESVCAVLLEPIQGESGVWPCTPEYLSAARRICDEKGALLILDEVQTGFFRTGTAFAFQGYHVKPDVVAMAKGMGNGYPIGAVAARDEVADTFAPGDHGTTYGGSPVVCAASLATIRAMLEESVADSVVKVGDRFREHLADLDGVESVRGRGLMVGVTLERPIARELAVSALGEGFVINDIGDSTLRFLPPLICKNEHVDALIDTLSNLLATVEPS